MDITKFNYTWEVYQKLEKVSFFIDGEAKIKCQSKITRGADTTWDGDAHRGLGERENIG